jgi:hypothetical protein
VLQNTRFPSTNNRNTTMASCTGRLQSGSSTYDNAPGEQHETGRTA